MAETLVEVDDEVTLLTVRTTGQAGPAVHFCEPIGHREHRDGPLEAWQPQPMPPAALDAARSIAARIVNSLGGRGVFSVELLVRGDEVYFSTVHVRPGDTGLVTLRSQRLSQFELHARAILGLPLDTIMISPAAAEVSDGRRVVGAGARVGRGAGDPRDRRAAASADHRSRWPPHPTSCGRGTGRIAWRSRCPIRVVSGSEASDGSELPGPAHDRAVSRVRWQSSCSS